MVEISFIEYLLLAPYIGIIFLASYLYGAVKQQSDPLYKSFFLGVFAKIIATLGFCAISIYYWGEGDTFAYHTSATKFVNLLLHSPSDFFTVMFGSNSLENYSLFSEKTGIPHHYLFFDSKTFFTIKLLVPFEILGFNSFLLANLALSFVSFSGFWKLYQLFCTIYPEHWKYFRWTILFFPSTLFFTGGLSKDILTFASFCWCCYTFFQLAIAGKFKLRRLIVLAISILILVGIKPYIAIILVPSLLVWWNSKNVKKLKSSVVRVVLYPLFIALVLGITAALWISLRGFLDEYADVESILAKAQVSQQDLQRAAYQGHSFDIGEFDQSLAGILAKFPIATASALFRPTIFEAENIVMYLAAVENAFILTLVILLLLNKRLSLIASIRRNPAALFCIIFSVFFAFGIGLSTANFGALARFRIPILPLFLSALVILSREKGKEVRLN